MNLLTEAAKFNLQSEFNKLNKLLFDDKLKPVSLIWKATRSFHGQFASRRGGPNGQISISNFYDWSEDDLRNTLAHEMIHAYINQNPPPYRETSHGTTFQNWMYKINSKRIGITVSVTKGASSVMVASTSVSKPIRVLIVKFKRPLNGKPFYICLFKSLDSYDADRAADRIKRSWPDTESVTWISSTNPELLRYSKSNITGRMKLYYPNDPAVVKDLMDTKQIKTFNFDDKQQVFAQ